MDKKHFLLIVALIILFSAIILRIKAHIDDQNSLSKIEKNTVSSVAVVDDVATNTLKVEETDKDNESELQTTQNINVLISSPEPSQIVTSPLLVQGKISGSWFFEATLPFSLVDSEENIISAGYAVADGDWMTEDLVPFSGVLDFSVPVDLESGYLIISKDNPSGLPENDGLIKMPVRFK